MIWVLHGFLGLPSDWDFLRDARFAIRAIDLWREEPLASLARATGHDAILGYSLGGRIALEILLRQRFAKGVIISAGLGTEDERERSARREADEAWALRFESDPWPELMREWNAQAVFGGQAIERHERDFDRRALAAVLRRWSSGLQEPLASRLHGIETPVLWIAGERDETYSAVASRATALLPNAELWICPGAGHRVPWEQPERLVARLRAFLE